MRILLLSNTSSGRGNTSRSAITIDRAISALLHAGHTITRLNVTHVKAHPQLLTNSLAHSDLLLIAGGDGTVHHALHAAIQSAKPIYHLPLGTENLFARHFGMIRDASHLLKTINAPSNISTVDTARATWNSHSRPFAIMASIGPDASIVARLAAIRKGGISHLSYLRPILAELLNTYLPRLSVFVDNRELVHNQRGLLIIANSPEYALGVNPARNACIHDAALDVVFMPTSTAIGASLWLVRCAARMQFHHDSRCEGCHQARGKQVHIKFHDTQPTHSLQLDGESITLNNTSALHCTIQPSSLRVLSRNSYMQPDRQGGLPQQASTPH